MDEHGHQLTGGDVFFATSRRPASDGGRKVS